jgi:competence protein ComGC
MNYLDDRKNMIVMLIVVGILAAAAIVMLLSVPNVLKSNAANLEGHNNTSGRGSSVLISSG